jgi:hypothetical protein
MLPQRSHITKKRGVYYYRRRIPKSPDSEVALSLQTRMFRVAEYLATWLDQEFRRLTEDVTTDDKTDLCGHPAKLPEATISLRHAGASRNATRPDVRCSRAG